MGKPTGFLEYSRDLPIARSPAARIRDWDEFHGHVREDVLRQQGARCMDCGVPFCHTGKVMNGMTAGCPLNNLIPEWNDLVYRGQWHEALRRLHKTNNFPEFTGRVCPSPCETSCVLALIEPAVTIKTIESAIADKGFEEGWIVPEPPARRTGKKVAIIGSGPAGLACGAQLNQAGHSITIFERSDRIGGLLTYGIPNMKLDKAVVQRRIQLLKDEGIKFVTNTWVGKDFPCDRLTREFNAIVLCGGAAKPRDLRIEGRDLEGVYFAMDFLHSNTKSWLDSGHGDNQYISAGGKDVIVIGGGDTGTDCVGTAIRHGCASLVQFEILPRPPDERSPDNPWPQWPTVYKLDYGHEEAISVFRKDPREFSIMTKRFLGEGGRLRAVETVRLQWHKTGNGKPAFSEVPGTDETWPAQLALIAMGFLGPETDNLLVQLAIDLDGRGNVRIDENYSTNVPGIFAAGDISRGQSLVVWAIADGRRAARGVDEYLMGETSLA